MWFYRNVVLFHIIFIVMHGEIFSHLGHTGPLTVNKMALPSMYRRRWRHIHAFIGINMIALGVQKFAAGANVICLTYATDWWAVIGPVIHGESKSQATRSNSDHVGLLHTQLSSVHGRVYKKERALKVSKCNFSERATSYELCAIAPVLWNLAHIKIYPLVRDQAKWSQWPVKMATISPIVRTILYGVALLIMIGW